MKSSIVFQFLFFALSFYCFGAGMMDSLVAYHSWNFINSEDFPLMHQESGTRIIRVFVLPTLLLTIITIIMIWKRPHTIPKSWFVVGLSFQMIVWLSSIFIQIPIQFLLDKRRDEEALQRLLTTDWIRIIAWLFYMIIVSTMLYRILAANAAQQKRT
jgi:hypothetical protein